MAQLIVKKGQTKALPSGGVNAFTGGAGWEAAGGVGQSPDLDLIVFRVRTGGVVEPICWPNDKWQRPDLGHNAQGSPYIATPEGDVVYQGDDRTGAESDSDYDETVKFDPSKAPADVESYKVFLSIYDEKGVGLTLGMATKIVCGFKDEVSGHELQAPIEEQNGFDVTVHVVTIGKTADGKWQMENIDEGSSDDVFTVGSSLGVDWKQWNDSLAAGA